MTKRNTATRTWQKRLRGLNKFLEWHRIFVDLQKFNATPGISILDDGEKWVGLTFLNFFTTVVLKIRQIFQEPFILDACIKKNAFYTMLLWPKQTCSETFGHPQIDLSSYVDGSHLAPAKKSPLTYTPSTGARSSG